jgi:hypothetical protein
VGLRHGIQQREQQQQQAKDAQVHQQIPSKRSHVIPPLVDVAQSGILLELS